MLKVDPEMRTRFWEGSDPLPDDLQWVWEAFWELAGSRPVTMAGLGPIPFEAIDRYAARYEIEDFEAFHRLIRRMDRAYLDATKPAEQPTRPTKDG